MKLSKLFLIFSALVLALAVSSKAHAFKILSALTEGCHEKMTLGMFGQLSPGGFRGDDLPSLAPLLTRLKARAETDGIPQDEASRGLRREIANRYGWGAMSEAELYIFSSILAGVRSPDTNGHSIVDFSQIRGSHIRDDDQNAHFLRRKDDDGHTGDLNVINATKTRLLGQTASVLAGWAGTASLNRTERWTFAFYGESDVTVFSPAFDLGLIVHALQDSYAHALRDETDMKIIAVENYIDLVLAKYEEVRDGPGHSERLDQCNEHDTFDAGRIETARALEAIDAQLAAGTQDTTATATVFDDIFSYRAGCTFANRYCDSLWYRKATEQISEPYEVGCGLLKRRSDKNGSGGGAALFEPFLLRHFLVLLLLASLPILTALGLRRTWRN